MNLIHKLKFRFSEPYRIRIGTGLSPIRSKREMKALIKFCKEELKDKKHMKLNPDRKAVYLDTIRLYDLQGSQLYSYINEHIGYYWN